MNHTPMFIPSALVLHYWAILIRLLMSLGLIITLTLQETFGASMGKYAAYPSIALVLFLFINDILILTLDFRRTDSYIGTILAQIVVSVLVLPPPVIMMKHPDFTRPRGSTMFVAALIHILCTLALLVTMLFLKRKTGDQASWKSNVKDMLLGCSLNHSQLSWFGRVRSPLLRKRDVSRFSHFWAVVVPNVLLRRISGVESKRYAVFQNTIALLLIVAIIVRAITALAQAQNQIETRSGVEMCRNVPSVGDVRVLVRHQDVPSSTNIQAGKGYNMSVEVTARRTGQYQCISELRYATPPRLNWFEVFNCGSHDNAGIEFYDATYSINIHSANGTSLDTLELPEVWFANFADTYQDRTVTDDPEFLGNVSPWLISPWQLTSGKHTKAALRVFRRRFITSSVFRDMIGYLKPTYRYVFLFTVDVQDTTVLGDNLTASALLTPSLMPSLSYLNDREGIGAQKDAATLMPQVCAYTEDYRSSTVFDVIGSIGGLLAILQGVHISLFGRPMTWAINGAMLISPFGLFGRCRSRAFRRRLRERYCREPIDGSTNQTIEVVRINEFLRDFVMDFGPADVGRADLETGSDLSKRVPFQPNGGRSTTSQDPNAYGTLSSRSPALDLDRQNSKSSYISMHTMETVDLKRS